MNTYIHTCIYCMHTEVEINISGICESGRCTTSYSHNLSQLHVSRIHIHFHPPVHHQMPRGKKSSLAYLCMKLRTLCSVCGSPMHRAPLPPQPATHVNTSASIFHTRSLSCHSAASQTRADFKSAGLFKLACGGIFFSLWIYLLNGLDLNLAPRHMTSAVTKV